MMAKYENKIPSSPIDEKSFLKKFVDLSADTVRDIGVTSQVLEERLESLRQNLAMVDNEFKNLCRAAKKSI